MSIRVRFAPSPTGALHIGGIRTALYNYLLAKKHGGTFILRIEDTDQTRFVEGAEDYIIEALKWCGIAPTEGVGFGGGEYAPYRQSERKDLYKKYADQLIANGHAYYAFDTPEELEAMRERLQSASASNQSYSMVSRGNMKNALTLSAEEVKNHIDSGKPYVIRLKVVENQVVKIDDLIRGVVSFNTNELDDKVLMKADGMPTYHLANIVDDYLMKITHVIRGEEWLPSAGHHALIYKAFGWEDAMPRFSHLPLILKPDGKGKLSKRDGKKFGFPVFPLGWKGATEEDSFDGFRELGFDPRAVINFLVVLGWNSGTEQEIFSMDELVDTFSLEKINNSGARFDFEKAKWFNQQYIMATPNEVLAEQLYPLSIAKGYTVSKDFLARFAGLMKERVVFFNEFLEKGDYFFNKPYDKTDIEQVKKRWKIENRRKFDEIANLIDALPTIKNATKLEDEIKNWIATSGLKMGDVLPILRLAMTGTLQGPPVFDVMSNLLKDETISRLMNAFDTFDNIQNTENMDISKNIVDGRIRKIVMEHPDWFEGIGDENQKISRAFLAMAVSSYLDNDFQSTLNLITDGGNDAGIDAVTVEIGDFEDFSFTVTFFQSKYVFDLSKNSNFPSNSVQKMIDTIKSVFDAQNKLLVNEKLKPKIEEIRSFIMDGRTPIIKCVMVNNGSTWTEEGSLYISNFLNSLPKFQSENILFESFTHNDIVELIQVRKGVKKAQLKLVGKAFEETFNYNRVIIGKVSVEQLYKLYNEYGDKLLEKNVRRHLGFKNTVNSDIQSTLLDEAKRENFYFFNNGITIVSGKVSYNALQQGDWTINIEDLQIVNGGQTCKTIYETVKANPNTDFSKANVLVRLYEIGVEASEELVSAITVATNNQSPIYIRDLKANDNKQLQLEENIRDLGYEYKRKRDNNISNGNSIPATVGAEAVYAIWRKKPDQAKFKKKELFGKFYEEVFNDLNGSQLIIAVLIYRYCDNQRGKREDRHNPYSNYFMSMIMGYLLLKKLNLDLSKLNHITFEKAKHLFEQDKENLYDESNTILIESLKSLEGEDYVNMDLRRLSAIFRGSELVNIIETKLLS